MTFFSRLLTIASMILLFSIAGSSQDNGEKAHRVQITTVFGDMIVELYNDTPVHRDNFLKNARNGWYDGTLFHRVIPGFMAQGGDPNSIGAPAEQNLGSDRCTLLPNEIRRNHFHKKGALAAARLPDGINPEKQSSGCQFFVVQGYRYNDAQLSAMETDNFQFQDIAKAYYKTEGGTAHLDMSYTIFGEVVEGIDIIDLICAMPTSKFSKDRPNTDIVMTVKVLE